MKRLYPIISLIVIICVALVSLSCAARQTDEQLIENIMQRRKAAHPSFSDREILDINRPVSATQCQRGNIWIVPIDDEGEWITENWDEVAILSFGGDPDCNVAFRSRETDLRFVEEFMEQINEKRLDGVALNNLIIRDLIVTLEFSDGSEIIFDRLYTQIAENLDDFRGMRF